MNPEGRDTAPRWIQENIAAGSHIALEAYGPFVDPSRFDVEGVGWRISLPVD